MHWKFGNRTLSAKKYQKQSFRFEDNGGKMIRKRELYILCWRAESREQRVWGKSYKSVKWRNGKNSNLQ